MKIIIALSVLAAASALTWAQHPSPAAVFGRYQIYPGYQGTLGSVLLDTSTGRTWLLKYNKITLPEGESAMTYWELIPGGSK